MHVDGWTEKVTKNETLEEKVNVDAEIGPFEMEKVDEVKYLGSMIQSNGSNAKERAAMAGRGTGLVSKIMNILHSFIF